MRRGTLLPCAICICPNGRVVLQFGSTSIHLSPHDFRSFIAALAEALTQLQARDEGIESERRHN
jgi:hypothetical protein